MAPGDNLNYMGHRYGALLIGLALTVWLGRNAPNTQARRALMIGAFVSLALTHRPQSVRCARAGTERVGCLGR